MNDKVFSGSFFASITKQLVRNLSRNSFLYGFMVYFCKSIFLRATKFRIFYKIDTKFVNRLIVNSGRKQSSFMVYFCKSISTRTTKIQYATIIKSEARPAGVQLKRVAKLLTVIGLTTRYAVCRITFMLYPILL